MLNIEKYKEEIIEEFEKGNHFEQCIHEVGFRHGAFQPTPGVNVIYVGDLLDWLTSEYKELTLILTSKEREYLSNIINPFKDKVKYICRRSGPYGEYIYIIVRSTPCDECIPLPRFAPNTMYKGMELYKEYTVKELGLC